MADSFGAIVSERIRALQHRSASALGVEEGHRKDTVIAMLANNAQRVPGYWIQLFLSMGISVLGLVLNSTAVVIGAMLVSPLMGPILELGMGLAVGSSLLVLRASLRVVLSVVLVVVWSALLVLVLPFHEVTNEIAARVAPTALDLLVAVFCALTAAYTTVRPGSDATAAAAGTAIGIALVPPLCTAGFGIGTASFNVATGAALLFTANMSAIVLFAVFSFLVLGFNQVSAVEVERDFLQQDGRIIDWAGRAHKAMGGFLGSRYGFATRLLIPGLLVAAVFMPLRRALDEVTWEVRAREAVKNIVAKESPGAVQTAVAVERHALSVQILRVGSSDSSAAIQERIAAQLKKATGVVPEVTVVEVAATRMLSSLAAPDVRNTSLLAGVSATVTARQRLISALTTDWPRVAGPLLNWEFTMSRDDSTTLVLRHLGDSLQAMGTAVIEHALSTRLGAPVRIIDVPVSRVPFAARRQREAQWLDSTQTLLAMVANSDSAVACISGPVRATGKPPARDAAISDSLRASRANQLGRVMLVDGAQWSLRLAVGNCTRSADAPSEKPK